MVDENRIEVGSAVYVAQEVASSSCAGCHLIDQIETCEKARCRKSERSDGKNAIFVRSVVMPEKIRGRIAELVKEPLLERSFNPAVLWPTQAKNQARIIGQLDALHWLLDETRPPLSWEAPIEPKQD